MTSEIKQTKAWAGSGVAVLINKTLSTASPEEKHSSWFNKTGYNKRFIWNILDLFIEDIFFFCLLQVLLQQQLLITSAFVQGLGGSDPAHGVLIAGTSQADRCVWLFCLQHLQNPQFRLFSQKKPTKKNPPKKPKQNKRTQKQQKKNQTKQNKIKKNFKNNQKKVKPAIFGSSPNTSCTKIFLQ